MIVEPRTVHLWRYQAKRWKLREINADGEEDGEGWIDQEPRGFHWAVERWISDESDSIGTPAKQMGDEGVETTYKQARDRVLRWLKIPLSRVVYLKSGTSNSVIVDRSEVEPKPPKPTLTVIKKTSKAARARPARKSAKGAWAKIRAFVMPGKKKKKGRSR